MRVFALASGKTEDMVTRVCEKLGFPHVIISKLSSSEMIPDGSVFVIESELIDGIDVEILDNLRSRNCCVVLIDSGYENFSRSSQFALVCKPNAVELERILLRCEKKLSHFSELDMFLDALFNLFDASNNLGIFVLDQKKKIVRASKNFEHLKNLIEREIEGITLSGRRIIDLQLGDNRIYLVFDFTPLPDGYSIALASNVTDIYEQNKQLMDKILVLEKALELSKLPIIIHADGKILSWNKHAESILGNELEGKNFFGLFDPESGERLKRGTLSMKFSKKNIFEKDALLLLGDRRIDVTVSTITASFGKDIVYVSAIKERDIERKLFRLLNILFKLHEELSLYRKKRIILQSAVRELEKEYKEVFIVSERSGIVEVYRGNEIDVRDRIENECIKIVKERGKELLVEKLRHFEKCIYEKSHRRYETFVLPLKIDRKTIGYLVVMSEEKFSEEELDILRTISVMISHIYYRSELEEIKQEALKQLNRNIREFSRIVDRIKNPLAVISGYCEIHEDVKSPAIIFSKIREEIKKMTILLENVEKNWEKSERILKKNRGHNEELI